MTDYASPAQTTNHLSAPIVLPDVVRGVLLFGGVLVLASFTALSEHMLLGPVAWVIFVAYAVLVAVAAARVVLVDARAPQVATRHVQRTRQTGIFQEIVIAGTGALLLLAPVAYAISATSNEVWAGKVEAGSDISPVALVVTALFGVLGFAMVFYRPQFVLEPSARSITRHPFGRSLPILVKRMPYEGLAVYSDGYFVTNGRRLGDIIRGRAGKYTFELERIYGNLDPAVARSRAMSWASALGAEYLTPDRAAAAELR